MGIGDGKRCYGMWLPQPVKDTEESQDIVQIRSTNSENRPIRVRMGNYRLDPPSAQSMHLVISALPLSGWPKAFAMSAAIKLPHADVPNANNAYAPISVLTEYISKWKPPGGFVNKSWPVGGVNLCSVMIDQVGFSHRRVHCIAEFSSFGPERNADAIIEIRGQQIEYQQGMRRIIFKQYGAAMLLALGKLQHDVLRHLPNVFNERLVAESEMPYYLSVEDLDKLAGIDHGILQAARTQPLRLWPLPHLLEFHARGATTADLLDGCGKDPGLRERLLKSFGDAGSDMVDGVVRMSFRYNGRAQRLECESPVDLIDILNCSVECPARQESDNTFIRDTNSNVAIGVALPDDGYARLRFFRPSVAKRLCFEAAFRYRVHESEAPGLLGEVALAIRQAGFRFQQMQCPSSFERNGGAIFEEGEIRGLFQLMGQDEECKEVLARADAREIRSRLYRALVGLQDINRNGENGRRSLSIFPPEYPRTLSEAARAWGKYALADLDD